MNERIDHANEAMAGLIGADQFLSEEMPSQIGEHKADMLAVAQVHATLALVEQQRIANVIQLALGGRGGWIGIESHAHEALIKADGRNVPRIHPDIAAALGIEAGGNDE